VLGGTMPSIVKDVLRLYRAGLTSLDIADRLGIPPNRVRFILDEWENL
jgi:hypothetical protein